MYITFQKKEEVIDAFESIGMQETLNTHFAHLVGAAREIARKKVYGWIKQRDHIMKMASCPRTSTYMTTRTTGTGTTLPSEVEEQLARWVQTMRTDGVPVTPKMLQLMALEYAVDVGLTESEFLASWHQEAIQLVDALQDPPRTINQRGERTVWVRCGGKTKDRATAMVMGDSAGNKYPLFAVLTTAQSKMNAVVQENLTMRHGFGKTVWRQVQPLQDEM
ncbi:hypothetical protein H310_13822 [Aphanomyces invadans]|uniref:HTH CENPB-type domain-containing protein n=1 Tax=Aphanomyces invadans TaxID=157072 RepID=A0A024TCM4_9STRA|nr:hypothetical protein H310_13822 [Aphanomyces invadans]ETV91764.1 hypothetical protein H310_13822 [Aphanomyces invadans]|eukprot:XP_008879690.1 hypothetical protein H310_13822 [Aphanomyces invadans]